MMNKNKISPEFKENIVLSVHKWIVDNWVPLSVFAISRLGLFIVVYLSLIFLPVPDKPGFWRAYPENLFLDGWSRWDSGWYVEIARNGYENTRRNIGQDTAFFPLYPVILRGLSGLVGNAHLAGILLSNVSFMCALIVLFKLVSLHYGSTVSGRTITLLSLSPFSFYFSAVYTESLFLLTVVCAFYLCERQRYLPAAVSAAAAGATRTLGLISVAGLLIIYMEQRNFDWRKIRPDILWFLLCLIGPGSYMAYLTMEFGDPLQFLHSQSAWGSLNPINLIKDSVTAFLSLKSIGAGSYPALRMFHLLIFVIAVILSAMSLKRLGTGYAVWSILNVLFSGTRIFGMGRFSLVVFPLFIVAALLLKKESWYHFVLCVNTMILVMFAIMFSHWYWVA